MHASAYQWGATILHPEEIAGKIVIEAGAMNVNGSVRLPIESRGPAKYIATDMRDGAGVDVVCLAEDLPATFGAGYADVVASFEMLEHAKDWKGAMCGLIGVLAEGGVLVVTTRSLGFPRHGYPDDHWRFSVDAMQVILSAAGLSGVQVAGDPEAPGVFARAVKPRGWKWPKGMMAAWDESDFTPVPA